MGLLDNIPDLGENNEQNFLKKLALSGMMRDIPNGYSAFGRAGYQFNPAFNAGISGGLWKSGNNSGKFFGGIDANYRNGANEFGLQAAPGMIDLTYKREF